MALGCLGSQNGFPGQNAFDAAERRLYHNITLCRLPRREKRQLAPVVDGLHVVAEHLQPSESATKLARRHRMRRRRGILDERVEEQETARREQSRDLRKYLSLQKSRNVHEVKRSQRARDGREVSLRAYCRLDSDTRLGRHLMPIK